MSVPPTAAEILRNHVTLEIEGIDRMYLNVYMPDLQRELGVVGFFRSHRGFRYVSGALMSPMSRSFVRRIEAFAEQRELPLLAFEAGRRKEDVALEYRRKFQGEEGVYLIGKAQEKARVCRTQSRVALEPVALATDDGAVVRDADQEVATLGVQKCADSLQYGVRHAPVVLPVLLQVPAHGGLELQGLGLPALDQLLGVAVRAQVLVEEEVLDRLAEGAVVGDALVSRAPR